MSPAWAGDNITYMGMHNRLRNKRGPAKEYPCDFCKVKLARDWSYDHEDPNAKTVEYRGRTVTYSTKMEHYRPLCKACHNEFDEAYCKPYKTHCKYGHLFEGNRTKDGHCLVCKRDRRARERELWAEQERGRWIA